MRYILCSALIYFVCLVNNISAQTNKPDVFYNETINDSIIGLKINPLAWDLAEPVISLKGDNQILLSFDDLSVNQKDYSYRIIHCDYMWKKSPLFYMDFIEGFEQNEVREYEDSFNTKLKYIHYKLSLPNEDVSFKISGNYIIQIFESFNEDNIILQARFSISENKVFLKAKIKHPIDLRFRDTHQELEFSIFHDDFKIDNPFDDIKIILKQNGLEYDSNENIKPIFIRKNELVYDSDYFFAANNEFRNFDMKSFRYQSRYIKNISTSSDITIVNLFPDKSKRFRPYLYKHDLNGKYIIKVQEYDDETTEADYAWVNFSLKSELLTGNVYVFGQLTNFNCSTKNKMSYNLNNASYELKLLLKQGYYNYSYAFTNDTGDVNLSVFEGSFWQTENDYFIYVYYYDVSMNCYRLIAHKNINSKDKM